MRTGIIAFCGSKGSGKSTSSDILKTLFSGPTEELAFANHLKSVCAKAFGVDPKYFHDPKLKEKELGTYVFLSRENLAEVMKLFEVKFDFEKHIRPHLGQIFYTGRSLLQYIGTEVLHPIDPLIHVKITLKKKDPNKLTIVTDLRFAQEFEAMLNRPDFIPVYVQNVAAENAAAGDTHKSEQGWKQFKTKCRLLDNNYDMNFLTNGIKDLVTKELV